MRRLCDLNTCRLILCGASKGVASVLGDGWAMTGTLDGALGAAEGIVLGIISRVRELETITSPDRREGGGKEEDEDEERRSGFEFALRLVDEQNGTHHANVLASAFRDHVKPLELKKGENIYDKATMTWGGEMR